MIDFFTDAIEQLYEHGDNPNNNPKLRSQLKAYSTDLRNLLMPILSKDENLAPRVIMALKLPQEDVRDAANDTVRDIVGEGNIVQTLQRRIAEDAENLADSLAGQ